MSHVYNVIKLTSYWKYAKFVVSSRKHELKIDTADIYQKFKGFNTKGVDKR